MHNPSPRIAIVYHGGAEARASLSPETRRLPTVFAAFESLGLAAEAVIYHDQFYDEAKRQLEKMDAVLVWVNPIEDGCDRTKLDALLRVLSDKGIYVSSHPDTILKLGTKEVLVRTKHLGWGSDVYLYRTFEDLRRELPARLERGEVRVLKQYRGQSGEGVWRVEWAEPGKVSEKSPVKVRHAKSGCVEETMSLDTFFEICQPYFSALGGKGCMVDQIFQPRINEGMVRCYLVGGKVEGFGRQEIVALHPVPEGGSPDTAPKPTKRHYHPSTLPEFQRLTKQLEESWVPGMQRVLGLLDTDLPALWDCDFMFGPKDEAGQDSYVLCEINISCVSPFPESAALPLARYVAGKLGG